jgi:protein-S-isoprenylcysteine O-methyltransferase Ste14
MAPLFAIYLIWIVWVLSWWAAALWTHPTVKRADLLSEASHRVLTVIGVMLLFGFASGVYDLQYRFWYTLKGAAGWSMAALVVLGFAFAWWARLHLGKLWSATVTRKSEHRVIDTGPYRYVRHPIYTGITLSTLATAIVAGTYSAFLGFVLMTAGWYFKARLEERFLREELGYEAYDSYARSVPMLVPFVHWPF